MATTENGAAGHNGDAQHGPLDQFAINRYVEIDLGGFDASFTNSALMMCVTVARHHASHHRRHGPRPHGAGTAAVRSSR